MLEGAELMSCDGAEWVELRLEEEGLVYDEDNAETLVIDPAWRECGSSICNKPYIHSYRLIRGTPATAQCAG